MKLYLVIYLAGLIGGTVGPLPYGEDECRERAAAMMAHLNGATTPDGYTKADVQFKCEWHDVRPENDPRAGKRKKSVAPPVTWGHLQ